MRGSVQFSVTQSATSTILLKAEDEGWITTESRREEELFAPFASLGR
jgi:hypothetical protein